MNTLPHAPLDKKRRALRRIAIVVCILLTGAISSWHIINSQTIKRHKDGLKSSDVRARSFEEMGGRHYRTAVQLYTKEIKNGQPFRIDRIDAIYDSIVNVEKGINGY